MPLRRAQRRVIVVGAFVGILLGAALSVPLLLPPEPAPARLTVVTSFYPLWEVAARLTGPDVRVESLVPPGVEPHDWEPTPSLVSLVEAADVLVYLHPDFETFVPDLLQAVGSPPLAVATAEGLDLLHREEGHEGHEEEIDPHVWLDPLRMMHLVNRTREALEQADPGYATAYRERAAALLTEVSVLHADMQAGLRDCRVRTFITAHAAFVYFAGRYGLRVEAISVSPEVEPSPGRILELADLARALNITVVYVEPLTPSGGAEALAEAIHGTTMTLDPVEGISDADLTAGPNYFTVMRNNLENLRVGLGCT